jgi:reactive chlorine resistance protein C
VADIQGSEKDFALDEFLETTSQDTPLCRKDLPMSAISLITTFSNRQMKPWTTTLLLTGARTVEAVGRYTARYGLVLALLWIGGMKFTAYEAEGISGFVSNSPLMSWAYSVFTIQSFSALLGVTEIAIALLIASRPLSARTAVVGSGLAVGMFLTTLSFLLTTPGVWETSAGGFPALSVVPGQFLAKDFVLFGGALRLFGEDWRALTTN